MATALELVFGLAFVSGWQVRYAACGATALFTLFALAMTGANGVKSPLNYSVFPDVGAAFMLAMILDPAAEQPTKYGPTEAIRKTPRVCRKGFRRSPRQTTEASFVGSSGLGS